MTKPQAVPASISSVLFVAKNLAAAASNQFMSANFMQK
jgi:hypothetical protein